MPIRREWRKFYEGPEWEAAKARVMERAGNKCEQCRKPNRVKVWTYTWKTRQLKFGGGWDYHMVWIRDVAEGRRSWRDQDGKVLPKASWPAPGLPRRIWGQIGVSHVDNNPANMDDANLRALCNWCHLHQDAEFHRANRAVRKDVPRPVIAILGVGLRHGASE